MKNLVAYEKERIFSYSSRIALNSAETVAFHKISGPGNQVKLWYLTQRRGLRHDTALSNVINCNDKTVNPVISNALQMA